MLPAPLIDKRTSDDVVRQLLTLLRSYSAEASQPQQEVFALDKGASRALVEIFGRFAELIIERLNQVPNKNLLAFLDLIGASLLPPQPARVPLTFSLANGSIVDGVVPAGTQVAAVPSENETAPVVFETETELVVTAAQLVSLFVRLPAQDNYADYSTLINSISADGVPLFQGNRQVEHHLYLAHDPIFSDPGLTTLTLGVGANPNLRRSPFEVNWQTWSGSDWISLKPENVTDKTSGLTISGDVVFQNLSPLLRTDVNGINKCWLRCRLLTPIPPVTNRLGRKLPELLSVGIKTATSVGRGLKLDHAIANDTKVDLVKGFFPFGERPKTGDTLYLAHQEVFKKNTTVTFQIKISNSPNPKAVELAYEFWDGNSWFPISKPGDGTNSLKESGKIELTIPKQPVTTTIDGIESTWIRIRIAKGNYGEDVHYELVDPNDAGKGYKLVPASYAPPLIDSLTVDYSITQPVIASPPVTVKPEVVLTYNDFEYHLSALRT